MRWFKKETKVIQRKCVDCEAITTNDYFCDKCLEKRKKIDEWWAWIESLPPMAITD